MDERQLLRIVSAGRVVVGAASVALPGRMARSWAGEASPGTKLFARTFGVRDIAMGVATMQALDAGRPVRQLTVLGMACDAVDVAATVLAARSIGLRRVITSGGIALSAAAIGAYAANRLED